MHSITWRNTTDANRKYDYYPSSWYSVKGEGWTNISTMIQQSPERILASMLDELEAVDTGTTHEMAATRQCLAITSAHIQQLYGFIDAHTFREEEEIHFFKTLKPQFDGHFIYYIRVMNIQKAVPVTGPAERAAYFKAHLRSIQHHYTIQNESWTYYRMNYTHLDRQYFLRNSPLAIESDLYPALADKKYNAPKSYTFARFRAFELLQHYLQHEIYHQGARSTDTGSPAIEPPLQWTGSKSGLTELIYALNEMGVFNGRQDIKKIVRYFSQVFNVQIANPYKIYEDNRLRKKSRTPFLDTAILALQRRYDHDDEYAL